MLHAHLLGFHGELLHDLLHLLWIHLSIDLLHDRVDTFERFNHLRVHLCGTQLRLNDSHLTGHGVVHVDLLAGAHQVLRHNLGGAVLVLLG